MSKSVLVVLFGLIMIDKRKIFLAILNLNFLIKSSELIVKILTFEVIGEDANKVIAEIKFTTGFWFLRKLKLS